MIGSLFCEVEGVLANTAPLRRAALLRAFAEVGFEQPDSVSSIPDHAGDPTPEIVRRALGGRARALDEPAIALIAHRAHRHFASLVHAGVSLAPGARELIERSVGQCRLAIVTDVERGTVESILALADLDGAFEVIIAADDVAGSKPAPTGYRKALDRLGRRRDPVVRTAVALEPDARGAHAARAAGIACVVVAPPRAERILEADAMLASLAGATLDTLEAALSLRAAG